MANKVPIYSSLHDTTGICIYFSPEGRTVKNQGTNIECCKQEVERAEEKNPGIIKLYIDLQAENTSILFWSKT